jgi:hypothetical protein
MYNLINQNKCKFGYPLSAIFYFKNIYLFLM